MILSAQVDTAWVRRYNGPGNSNDDSYEVAIDRWGNVYVTGGSIAPGFFYDIATIKYYPNGDTAWVRRYNGPANDEDQAFSIALDTVGNVYVAGVSVGLGTDYDGVTIKYYPDGETAWVRRYNGPYNGHDRLSCIAVDDPGNVYVTGVVTYSSSIFDYLTIKYSSNGDTAWVRRYNGPGNGWDLATALAIDDSGCVYITGISTDTDYVDNFVTIKYQLNGDTAWVRRLDLSEVIDIYYNAIAVDDQGYVYVTGQSLGPAGNDDFLTVKYHPNGDTAWTRKYNSPGNSRDMPWDIAVDAIGNVYVTGESSDSNYNIDYATAKYLPDGDTAWVRCYNGPGEGYDAAYGLTVDGSGNVLVAGASTGSATAEDFAIIKYNPYGNIVWIQRYNGSGNGSDAAVAIDVDAVDNVYVTGGSTGAGSADDYATIKYSPTGEVDERWITHVPVGQKIDIFPNPCRKVTSISIGQMLEGKELRIYDISGRLIARHAPCTMPYALDLTGLAPGVYFVQVDGVRAVGKIVITK